MLTACVARSVLGNSAAMQTSALVPLWTLSRGDQVITCELVSSGAGPSILRCGLGSHTVVRSQFIASEDAATEVSEAWRAALLLEGFRVD